MDDKNTPGNTLSVKLQTVDDKAMFDATARDNPAIVVDFFPPVGTGKGYTSLELLMISFGSCLSTVVMTLLRYKMNKAVEGVSVELDGTVREEHPKALSHIVVRLDIKAKGLTESDVQNALTAAEETMCPVWSMIRGNVDIKIETSIIE